MSRTRNSFPKVFNFVTRECAEAKITTQRPANNSNSSSVALLITRKHKRADTVDADAADLDVLAPLLCQKKLAHDEYSLTPRAGRKTADIQHVVIKTGEFQRDEIGVLALPNHAAD